MIDPADKATRQLPQATRLRFASHSRVYSAVLTQDLFEQWIVVQSWGGRGSLRGGGKTMHVDSFDAGMDLLHSIRQTREKRGYRLLG